MRLTISRVYHNFTFDALKFDDINSKLVSWWRGGIKKNTRAHSQPLVRIYFRQLNDDNSLSEKYFYRDIGISYLNKVKLGSVWYGNQIYGLVEFTSQTFDISVKQGEWWLTSFYAQNSKNYSPPFPYEIYPIADELDKSWLMQFKLSNDKKLTIPCLEYFSRCYGSTEYLRRNLCSYTWDDCKERFYRPIDNTAIPAGTWGVNLNSNLSKMDALLLGYARYSKYTETTIKRIGATLMSENNGSRDEVFLRISPWYAGPSRIRADGIPYRNGFLALRVTGMSRPTYGRDILRVEDYEQKRPDSPDAGNIGDTGINGNPAPRPKPQNTPPPGLDNYTDENPTNDGSTEIHHNSDFKILGDSLGVESIRNPIPGSPRPPLNADSTTPLNTVDPEEKPDLSADAPYGHGENVVNHVKIETPIYIESEGALRDIWNCLIHLKESNRNIVKDIALCSSSIEFISHQEISKDTLKLIPFQKITKSDIDAYEGIISQINTNPNNNQKIRELKKTKGGEISKSIRSWPFIDPDRENRARGLLVVRIELKNKFIYIMEIERRKRKVSKDNKKIETEENFSGLIFTLDEDNPKILKAKINLLLSRLRFTEGVFKNVFDPYFARSIIFKHRLSKGDDRPYWTSLTSALKKIHPAFNEPTKRK